MSEDDGAGETTDESTFTRMVASVMSRSPDEPVDVPEDVVYAYLSGAATSEEYALVVEALSRSKEFRAHVLAMAEELQRVQSPEFARGFQTAEIVPPPPYRLFLVKRWFSDRFSWAGSANLRALAAVVITAVLLGYPTYRGLVTLPGVRETARSNEAELANRRELEAATERKLEGLRSQLEQARRDLTAVKQTAAAPPSGQNASSDFAPQIASLESRVHDLEERNAALLEELSHPANAPPTTVAALVGTSVFVAPKFETDSIRGTGRAPHAIPTVHPSRDADWYVFAFSPPLPAPSDPDALLALELVSPEGRVVARESFGAAELKRTLSDGSGWEILEVPQSQAKPGVYTVRLIQTRPSRAEAIWEERFSLGATLGGPVSH